MARETNLFVISHTHWDREWYQTFQGFRRRLVLMMDELIEYMEKDPDYKYFHLDGQTIMLEDYLEIKPEMEQRLKALIRAGRIIAGPWYVMPDEFLVSGESLVRNLQKGFSIVKDFGGVPMKCGYVVDIFGHNSQFPQILTGFGISSSILFRGIGDYPKDTFTWEGVDGSRVFCMKMDRDRCYSNIYFALRKPFEGRKYEKEELVSRMKELMEYCRKLAVSENLLMMDGVDHCEIEPMLPQILSVLNSSIENINIRQSTLEEYVRAQMDSGAELEVIKGELYNPGRKGVNNSVVKNVLSSMVHIKQMNNDCELLLTRWAEPFDAIAALMKPQNNKGFFDRAWKYLLQNHPHDSICGCSISRVHKDNEYRYNQVSDIANDIIASAFEDIADSIDTSAFDVKNCTVFFNASQQEFNGILETEIEFDAGSQGNFKLIDSSGNEVPYQLLGVRRNQLKRVVTFRKLVNFQHKDLYRIAFNAAIPAVGFSTYGGKEYRTVMPGSGDYSYKEFAAPTRYCGTMQTGHRTWENEYLKLSINSWGTLSVLNKVTGKKYNDLLIFEDCADIGDGWNYKKPLKDSRYLSLGIRSNVAVESDGPFLVRIKLTHYMELPVDMGSGVLERPGECKKLKIVTYIDMKKGSRMLNFLTVVQNNVAEHRLRVLFPNYIKAGNFFTSTPFFLQERSVVRIDSSDFVEPEAGACPNQGVVLIKDGRDCLALYNKGLYEVEVSEDDSRTISLTLLRSFKNEVGRDKGEMSLMYGKFNFEYALEFFDGSTSNHEVMLSGEAWRTGVRPMSTGMHPGCMPMAKSFVNIDVPGTVLSSLRTNAKNLRVLRLYNCTDVAAEGEVTFHVPVSKAYFLDLNEDPTGEVIIQGNKIHLTVEPAQIVTLGIL